MAILTSPYPIKPLGTINVSAVFGNTPVMTSVLRGSNLQPYRFHGPRGEDYPNRSNYGVTALKDDMLLVWFTQSGVTRTYPVVSITCSDLVFQKRSEKEGLSSHVDDYWDPGGVYRMEMWWAHVTHDLDVEDLNFVLVGGNDAQKMIAGWSIFRQFRVPELPWDQMGPSALYSAVPTSNTIRTFNGHLTWTYSRATNPYEFISIGDALVGTNLDSPLLIDLTMGYKEAGPGIGLWFPTDILGDWGGLSVSINQGEGVPSFEVILSYRQGAYTTEFVGVCVPPIPIEIPDPAVVPATILAWPLEPDWADGVTERILWKTDVLRSQPGVEQRRRLRNTPRRQIEASFTLLGMDRRVYDTVMNGPAVKTWHYPLWWEKYHLTAAASAGATVLHVDDTTGSEVTSGSVLMLRTAPFTTALVTVASVGGGTINLTAPLARAWVRGATVYLTKLCRMTGEQRSSRRADDAAQVVLTFDTVEPNDFTGTAPPVLLNDQPILDLLPNEAEEMTYTHSRLMQEFDNQTTSVPLRRDLSGQSFMVQQFTYMTVGRRHLGDLRGLLYFLQGKLVPLYVPTYFRDVELMPRFHAEPDTTTLNVQRTGYTDYHNASANTRKMLLLQFRDGTAIVRTVVSSTIVSEGQELLEVDEPFFHAVSNTLTTRICWLAFSRQDQDEIEILHHAEGKGAATLTTTFATLAEGRVAEPYMTMEVFNGSHDVIVGQPTPPVPDGPIPPVDVDPVPPDEGDTGGGTGGDGGSTGGGGGE